MFDLSLEIPLKFPLKLKSLLRSIVLCSHDTLIKFSLLEGRVMTNASALPVQRQVLEQLFISDPKVGFGQLLCCEFATVI